MSHILLKYDVSCWGGGDNHTPLEIFHPQRRESYEEETQAFEQKRNPLSVGILDSRILRSLENIQSSKVTMETMT